MPKFEANMNYIPPNPPSSMKQCNKSATVKFHMELLLTTTTRKQSRSGATPSRVPKWRKARCNETTENVFYHFICLLVCTFVKCVIKLQEIKCTSKICLFIHIPK